MTEAAELDLLAAKYDFLAVLQEDFDRERWLVGITLCDETTRCPDLVFPC